jgi:hypothetical protein
MADLKPPKPMRVPDTARLIGLEKRDSLTREQVEQMRFGLGAAGPLASAVMNSNPFGLLQSLPVGVTAPTGAVMAFAKQGVWAPPAGWLECDGATITESQYPKLYNVVGSTLPSITQISSSVRYVVKF